MEADYEMNIESTGSLLTQSQQPQIVSQGREFFFDFIGPNPNVIFSAAEMKILELITRCITGALVCYFSLSRIWSEFLTYNQSLK